MSQEFFAKAHEMSEKGESFAVATVVQIEGSSAAKPGAKAIISERGETLWGWVGGGCAESLVAQNALESLHDERPRVIEIDLTDEVLGAGMPCGGKMFVYIEPVLPKPHLLIVGHGAISENLSRFAQMLDFRVTVDDPLATAESFQGCQIVTDNLDFSKLEITPRTYIVIATQHKSDHLALQKVLEDKARYVALIASRKRARLVLEYLRERGCSEEQLCQIRAPAGLELGAITPEEIALSILSEIVAVRRKASLVRNLTSSHQ
ncbi:XdhC family protein [Candidatus Acetothermia bacterium]|nr:XdhC family protein [Candidatus Acetothermia bacterium]